MRSNLLATAAVLLGLSVVSSANAMVVATPASAGADAAVGFNFVAEPHGPAPVAISSPFTINGFAFGSMMWKSPRRQTEPVPSPSVLLDLTSAFWPTVR